MCMHIQEFACMNILVQVQYYDLNRFMLIIMVSSLNQYIHFNDNEIITFGATLHESYV